MEGEKKRFDYIDWVKAIAICCIVAGHFFPRCGLKSLLYSFHVPIFAVVGGFLLRAPSDAKQYGKKMLQTVKRLLIPYFIWYAVFAVFQFIPPEVLDNPMVKERTPIQVLECIIFLKNLSLWNEALWFVPAYFIVSSFSILFTYLTKGNKIASVICAVLAFTAVIIMDKMQVTINLFEIENIMGMRNIIMLLGFFLLGYSSMPIIDKIMSVTKSQYKNPFCYLGVVLFVVFAIIKLKLLKIDPTKSNPQGYYPISLYSGKYSDMLYYVVLGVGLCYSLILFSGLLPKCKFSELFSKHSYFIMLTHYGFFLIKSFGHLSSSMWEFDYTNAFRDAAFILVVYWFILLIAEYFISKKPKSVKYLRLVGFN